MAQTKGCYDFASYLNLLICKYFHNMSCLGRRKCISMITMQNGKQGKRYLSAVFGLPLLNVEFRLLILYIQNAHALFSVFSGTVILAKLTWRQQVFCFFLATASSWRWFGIYYSLSDNWHGTHGNVWMPLLGH